jgi:hypothetical protein
MAAASARRVDLGHPPTGGCLMFPTGPFLAIAAALAVIVASALPFPNWRVLIKHIVIALVVTYTAIAGAIVMGMVFHLGIFGEPVMID